MYKVLFAGFWFAALATRVVAVDDHDEFFESKIRPLLAAHCFKCHGDDDPKAGLRLNSRDNILRGGESGPAASPQHVEESLLVSAIRYDGELQMPPDGKLADEEIALLTRWVELGLPWPTKVPTGGPATGEMIVTDADRQHWAFQPIADPPIPQVADKDWPRTSIDRFLLARLESVGLRPAPAADRRTLLRRAYCDLIGLPPTYEEVQAFVADPSPDAFATVVDRLLQSPRYGERWGRHWLDVARYADTKDGVLMYGDAHLRPTPTRIATLSFVRSMKTCRSINLCTSSWRPTSSARRSNRGNSRRSVF